jgi:adenylate cyclase
MSGRYDDALIDARKAVELAPGSADVANLASFHLTAAGYPDEAVQHSKNAIALNPNYPANYLGNLGFALRLAGRVEEAISACEAYNARVPGKGFGLADLVVLHQQSGRPEEARQSAERLLDARPEFSIAAWSRTQIIRDAARLDADVAALRAAGLPEG